MKEASVFKEWKEDTEKVLTKCLGHDLQLWKLDKITADTEEQEKVKEVKRLREERLK